MSATPKSAFPGNRRPPLLIGRVIAIYLAFALLPYFLALTQGLEQRGWLETSVSVLSIAGLTALLAQFALSGRLQSVTQFAGIDNGMRIHRKAGELVALFFFLHPFLIALPRFWIAPQLAVDDLWLMLTSSESATGVFAWALMGFWVVFAMLRDRLPITYETWRISHGLGLVAVAILATHHAVTVGRHGVYQPWFDYMWITMCTIAVSTLAYTYVVRPWVQRRKPFKIVDVQKQGLSDWSLTIEKDGNFDFDFDAGQFVWINTSGNPFNRHEHPFTIASSPSALPRVSFVIRAAGDYTSNLDQLSPGQKVYVDGPHGAFTLTGRKSAGVGLIAGGCGIAGALGILRQMRDHGSDLPVRLVYGNRVMEQMVFQDEITAANDKLSDFEQVLAVEEPDGDDPGVYRGQIDSQLLDHTFNSKDRAQWTYYVCGSKGMVDSVVKTLRAKGIPAKQILYEQLAF